jgi:hypothetical protein
MPNDCIITISRGKNKGKMCSEVHNICRHQKNVCLLCGEQFSYKHTLTAHTRQCYNDGFQRTKVVVIKKPDLLERISTLEKRNRVLEDKVKKVEKQPRINNIMVIGNDFFQELVTKIGKDSAVEFLTLAATSGKAIDVIDKLYLEGKDPMSYPIACRNDDHFRFRRLDGEKVVDDRGGAIIGDIMMNQLCNAFLMAANELISKHVECGEDSDPTVLRNVQQNISSICDKSNIVYQLAAATNNSSHPFFRDDDD